MTTPDLQKRPEQVSSMFDRVSKHYDRTNDILTAGIAPYWRSQTRHAVRARPGDRVLDIAAGTGTMSKQFADAGADVVALDFSQGMIDEGRRRHGDDPRIDFVQGDAMALPFDDASFDAVTISFGLRNVQKPQTAIDEMLRVLRPGGRAVICEFSTVTSAPVRAFYTAYMKGIMPAVVRAVSSDADAYAYLNESIEAWPPQPVLAGWLRTAGFERVKYRNLSFGMVALHKGFTPLDESSDETDQ
ncbi:demethylmenaquinone methyltransferase [Pseudoclavibacter endophyticus]|uniref:Demethylmenaquinone methyltransferase n=1 Tax=Pseudoclavibacter endophyticus TaxID=1778590 RepID=A0A6H9WPJ9_9MICO|nr:bifunctional demethylmenaquinone methyltransferase/2-methoxy-6-polyprenyl-1,4-benzoquinol methylase UbiE [Pseudoclavibacter endophyticus]KAB1648031.1 bifunctional demethylmenaquinone methyltransferase/2-methoxy-6-polyprenyl-1,4-benzoquinol methylase UbiE [Pseudoclavibacter endophyticus]GGA69153.1 demethylmenaquinone methyltransferase [Pseudoclavibacter endophyticus]